MFRCVGRKMSYSKMAAFDDLDLDTEMQQVRVVFLGSQGVGKTSIIRQFVNQQFSDAYAPTRQRECYYPSVITNNRLYEVKIVDCPMIPYFPANSLYEWTDFRGYGLRNASAYVLVYDVTNDQSFRYIRTLHEQLLDSHDTNDLPIVVVGNKHDLIEDKHAHKREYSNVAKKQWKCAYFECSAKFNWHIIAVFKEVMRAVDCCELAHKQSATRMHDALRRNKCVIL